MRIRRILVLGVLGLLGSTQLAAEAKACHGCKGGRVRGHGRTYHYNGVQGYWNGGGCPAPAAYAQAPAAYAQPAAYAAPQATYGTPQVTPQYPPAPAKTTPVPPAPSV